MINEKNFLNYDFEAFHVIPNILSKLKFFGLWMKDQKLYDFEAFHVIPNILSKLKFLVFEWRNKSKMKVCSRGKGFSPN